MERSVHKMISTPGVWLRRAKDVFQREGLTTLLRRSFRFVRPWFFEYGKYYLYEHTLKERNEADFMPKIEDFTFKIISTNKEADEMAAATGFDLRRRFVDARNKLDKGAIAFCIFIKREIVHIGWVGMTEEAKESMSEPPYKVDFLNNEACTGGTLTIPEYRGKGLMSYGYFKRFQFLREKGIVRSRNAVDKSNIASQRAHAKFGPKVHAEARYLKLLWWKFWKETPLTQTGQRD